ncbi:putative telomerase-binding protein est1a protein [Erysiphe necator]|uniref:Putative telomerase-binding protein est1a protein n=1 Tax=Uncinula necator TaxID=52586 RepID=A0A0B1P9J3_UNCNE|nr:putative telomerase-binding protein est1a protein [Erysiphe necator]
MLSDRWIRHQRKQNRPRVEQQLQGPFKEEVQSDFCKSSLKACSIDKAKKEPPKSLRNLNEGQFSASISPSVSGKRHSPTRTVFITSDSKLNRSVDKTNMMTEKNTRDERRFKRAARGDGISSSGSTSPCQNIDAPSSPKLKTHRTSNVRIDPLVQRRSNGNTKSIWVEGDVAPTRTSVDQSNIASVAIARKRNQFLQNTARPSTHSTPLKSGLQLLNSAGTTNIEGTNETTTLSAERRKLSMVLQPGIKPLTQEQLIARVKSIYVELVAIETKCISFHSKPDSVVRALTQQTDPNSARNLNHDGIQKLIALHRKLLYHYHDFFLATQHPLASIPVRRLASKYAMPARLWRHGIHSFLELLRHLLPASFDYMLSFIYLSYSTIALLFETVSVFEDTWIECLGDLSRYRMAIEEDNSRDREIWTNVARDWYIMASNNSPTTGRLYHHMAILARPNAIEQLFYYSKSLCSPKPFFSARESILTLFEPILEDNLELIDDKHLTLDILFVKAHGILFTNSLMDKFTLIVQMITHQLHHHVKMMKFFRSQSYHMAIINCVALLEYGAKSNNLLKLILKNEESNVIDMEQNETELQNELGSFARALNLSNSFLASIIGVTCLCESDTLPYIHVTLVFIFHIAMYPKTIAYIKNGFPWESLATKLNGFFLSNYNLTRIEDDEFPNPEDDKIRPLPEDYAMRGFVWATEYFPNNWFSNDKIEEEEKYREHPSLDAERRERILWLAHKISKLDTPLIYRGKVFSALMNDSRESVG